MNPNLTSYGMAYHKHLNSGPSDHDTVVGS